MRIYGCNRQFVRRKADFSQCIFIYHLIFDIYYILLHNISCIVLYLAYSGLIEH